MRSCVTHWVDSAHKNIALRSCVSRYAATCYTKTDHLCVYSEFYASAADLVNPLYPADRSSPGRTQEIGVSDEISAAAKDGNSPDEVLRRIPEAFLEEHLRCAVILHEQRRTATMSRMAVEMMHIGSTARIFSWCGYGLYWVVDGNTLCCTLSTVKAILQENYSMQIAV